MNSLSLFNFPLSYLQWHYGSAWGDLVRLYTNFSWFLWNFFSIRLLTGTLFASWKRRHESSKKELAGFIGSFILNVILRGIGICARSGMILCGLLALALLSVLFGAVLVLWVLAPLLAAVLFVNGAVIVASF